MYGWLTQYFFNPGFVLPWGAALVGVPIIIHLLNRVRYRRVRFAAMEFLLQSEQQNRRRLLLEQLLLLMLRVAAVMLLVALIARMILDPEQMSIFRGAKAHHVVLLDDSGSMRNQWGETTAFAEGLEVVKKLVAEGARRPDTQKFSLLLLSDPHQPLFTQRDVNDDFLNELETKLENVRCTYRTLDLVAGLDAGRELLQEDRGTIQHLHVISDFRLGTWQRQKAASAAVRSLDEADVAVNLVRTVAERHFNLGITELSGNVHVAAVGVPMRLTVGVKNFSDQVAENVRVAVASDGNRLPLSIIFDRIEADDEVTREFDLVFDSPGKHRVEVGLEADSLSADNSRFLAFEIAPSNPVLIIDGDPSGEEGSYVADALAADPSLTGFAPLIESPDYLRRHPIDSFQCIYMLNVPELPADALQVLSDYVETGGGLAWFVGDSVKPAFYNDKLYEEGAGLFPVPLELARRELPRDDLVSGPDLNFVAHPIFRIFEGQENPFIDSVRIQSYLPVAEDWERDDNERNDGVTTLATLRNRQPLMFEHTYGAGRVITCLTTGGPMWTNWPLNPSYIISQLELQKYIARNDRTLDRRVVGEEILLSLDPSQYTETVEIVAPETAGQQVTRLQAAPDAVRNGNGNDSGTENGNRGTNSGASDEADELRLTAIYRETDAPGIYAVKLLDQNQMTEDRWIAYNVPLEESDLELADSALLRQEIGDDVRVQIQEAGSFQWIQGRDSGQEIRRLLLILLILVLVAEQLLAYKLSYHPQTAGATA